jgi:16S rRNA (guanine966-N2)-methyltransferase
MRVVAGEAKGRRLQAPEGDDTRPTSDRVREAMFNSLASMDALDDAKVLDLFAGSGALGIEALSRYAARCTFVERARPALDAIRANLDVTGLSERADVVVADAMTFVSQGKAADFDLVLADPPYDFSQWNELLQGVSAPLLVAESNRTITPPEGWEVLREKRYGRTWVTFLERA